MKQKTDFERELKDRRAEVQRSEQRVAQREDTLAKKEDALDKKLENVEHIKSNLKAKEEEINKIKDDISDAHNQLLKEIENAAQMTKDAAKEHLINLMKDDAQKKQIEKLVISLPEQFSVVQSIIRRKLPFRWLICRVKI